MPFARADMWRVFACYRRTPDFKLAIIEQLQCEITSYQQQITECNFVLGQLANKEEE